MAAQRMALPTHPHGANELTLLYTHHLSHGFHSGIGLLLACITFAFTTYQSAPVTSGRYRFTPGLMNHGPAAEWAALHFDFNLR
jgi:hypothetical protein